MFSVPPFASENVPDVSLRGRKVYQLFSQKDFFFSFLFLGLENSTENQVISFFNGTSAILLSGRVTGQPQVLEIPRTFKKLLLHASSISDGWGI